jgi:hypothetical protein
MGIGGGRVGLVASIRGSILAVLDLLRGSLLVAGRLVVAPPRAGRSLGSSSSAAALHEMLIAACPPSPKGSPGPKIFSSGGIGCDGGDGSVGLLMVACGGDGGVGLMMVACGGDNGVVFASVVVLLKIACGVGTRRCW